MKTAGNSQIMRTIPLLITIFSLSLPAYAQYNGGTGEPNDPYQIATADDLILLGDSPEDYDKHFILTADIDLDPSLPGGRAFDRAVVASRYSFTGVFDGNGYRISHLTIAGEGSLGLFGSLDLETQIKNLGLEAVDVQGTGGGIGGLVGVSHNGGPVPPGVPFPGSSISDCYSTGSVRGGGGVGGLVGRMNSGTISGSYSSGTVTGEDRGVGGLVGAVWDCDIGDCSFTGMVNSNNRIGGLAGELHSSFVKRCYAVADVSGSTDVGGFVGLNCCGYVSNCYADGAVVGESNVGGLAGANEFRSQAWPRNPEILNCYSTSGVTGLSSVGGLVGFDKGIIQHSYWDIETSGQATSAGGTGLTTTEMQTASTFLEAGWDFIDEVENGSNDIWKISEGLDYPRLWWEKYSGGTGEPNDPYQIATAEDLILLGETPEDYDKNFILTADIDLDPNLPGRKVFDKAVIAPHRYVDGFWLPQGTPFTGIFNGNEHTISHLTITGVSYLGLFGKLGKRPTVGEVTSLGLIDVNISGSVDCIGGLVGQNDEGLIAKCYTTGYISGLSMIGGLVGSNSYYYDFGDRGHARFGSGRISNCYSACNVTGTKSVGGLSGNNDTGGTIKNCYSTSQVAGDTNVGDLAGTNGGSISNCYSTGPVTGEVNVGGLVGNNSTRSRRLSRSPGSISNCYSASSVNGTGSVGGLVGDNYEGSINMSYSTGMVTGDENIGGLVGYNGESITKSFWDIETSGMTNMCGGESVDALGCDDSCGKTTGEMQTESTFTDGDWDFVDEIANGTDDIWWILEGQDYPRLWWESE